MPGKLADVAKGRDAMMLTVERPPEKSWPAIVAYETWDRCPGPFVFEPEQKGRSRSRSDVAPLTEKERIDQLLAGRSHLTIVLSREEGAAHPNFGIDFYPDNPSVIATVQAGSPAECAGVLPDDQITKVNNVPWVADKKAWAEVADKKGGQNLVITVARIERIVPVVSSTHTVGADL